MIITERQAEVLSYLVGLAPVGQPISVNHKTIKADLGMEHGLFYCFVRRLKNKAAVETVIPGRGATPCTMRVLKRPEAFEVKV